MSYIAIAAQGIVTLLAIVALAVKLEHRLTQIETDITWIKSRLDNVCQAAVHCEENPE